jgi:hypothetical protein
MSCSKYRYAQHLDATPVTDVFVVESTPRSRCVGIWIDNDLLRPYDVHRPTSRWGAPLLVFCVNSMARLPWLSEVLSHFLTR